MIHYAYYLRFRLFSNILSLLLIGGELTQHCEGQPAEQKLVHSYAQYAGGILTSNASDTITKEVNCDGYTCSITQK